MSTEEAEITDGMQRGAVAAILHVAEANAAAAREIVCEFVAASDEVRVQAERIPLSLTVAPAFARGLSREQLLKLSCQRWAKSQLLDAVRSGAAMVSHLGEAELDRYRRIVIEAADRAAAAVKESEFFSRRRKTRSEVEAIGEIRAALARGHAPFRRNSACPQSSSRIGASGERRIPDAEWGRTLRCATGACPRQTPAGRPRY